MNKENIKALTGRNNRDGLLHMASHVFLIGLTMLFLGLWKSFWVSFLLTFILGGLLVFLFAPLHESIHKTAFKSGWMNTLTALVCGLVLLLPPKYFQSFHMAHHRFTQRPGKDPELDVSKPQSMRQYLWYLTGFNYWKEQISALFGYTFTDRQDHFVHDTKLQSIRMEATIYLLFYLLLFSLSLKTGSFLLLTFWIFPVLSGQPLLRAFLLAEHALCPQVPKMTENTRTTLTGFLIQWLCWNMNYHVEHHADPAIPFHQLPDAHKCLRSQIKYLDHGYLDVNRQIIRCCTH